MILINQGKQELSDRLSAFHSLRTMSKYSVFEFLVKIDSISFLAQADPMVGHTVQMMYLMFIRLFFITFRPSIFTEINEKLNVYQIVLFPNLHCRLCSLHNSVLH